MILRALQNHYPGRRVQVGDYRFTVGEDGLVEVPDAVGEVLLGIPDVWAPAPAGAQPMRSTEGPEQPSEAERERYASMTPRQILETYTAEILERNCVEYGIDLDGLRGNRPAMVTALLIVAGYEKGPLPKRTPRPRSEDD